MVPVDDHHILSQFEDPERKVLISCILESDLERLRKVTRCGTTMQISCFVILRHPGTSRVVSTPQTVQGLARSAALKITFKSTYSYDVAGIYLLHPGAGKLQFNKAGDERHLATLEKPIDALSQELSVSSSAATSCPVSPGSTLPQLEADPKSKRDMEQCLLTKRGLLTIQTAHIVPNKPNLTSKAYLI
ncbi:hypothetical protein N7517_005711 [Penicillium concentricum]|uniref:Uncharacterized protein n=1 Tax=Penicillium concentricum TaxID=293559 RepID=A0A9W9VBR3_9EURO|nr:uncharacterized protein N7517_005711 [Penicillium concentricum]KAJ5373705.1 hypothetical protein N7517_005711 [Penicillium concentricum]